MAMLRLDEEEESCGVGDGVFVVLRVRCALRTTAVRAHNGCCCCLLWWCCESVGCVCCAQELGYCVCGVEERGEGPSFRGAVVRCFVCRAAPRRLLLVVVVFVACGVNKNWTCVREGRGRGRAKARKLRSRIRSRFRFCAFTTHTHHHQPQYCLSRRILQVS